MITGIRSYGSLFTGIGGLDLAVESVTKAECVWQCEADDWRRDVLERHWGAIQYDDVRRMESHDIDCDMDEDCTCGAGVQPVDLICGGFPCQDVATNGKREGIEGERSGLWAEFARVVRILRPRFVFVENVPGLLARGMGRVLGDLASLGFDAEWTCLRASDAGALHHRRRVFILAHAHEERPRRAVGSWGRQSPGDGARGGCLPGGGSVDRPGEWSTRVGWDHGERGVGRVAHGVPASVARRRLMALGDAVCWPQAALALTELLAQIERRAA